MSAPSKKKKKKKLFDGVRLFVLLKGLVGSQARYNALRRQAAKNGATVLDAVLADAAQPLVMLSDCPYERSLAAVNLTAASPQTRSLRIVRPEWLSDSLRTRERRDFVLYESRAPPTAASSSTSGVIVSPLRSSPTAYHVRGDKQARTLLDGPPTALDEFHPLRRYQDSPERRLRTPSPPPVVAVPSFLAAARSLAAETASDDGGGGGGGATSVNSHSSSGSSSSSKRKRELSPDDPLAVFLDEPVPARAQRREKELEASALASESSSGSHKRRARVKFNDIIVSELKVLEKQAKLSREKRDRFRAQNYRAGIDAIERSGCAIYSTVDLRSVAGFQTGSSLFMKASEIIARGSLRRAELVRQNPEFQTRERLSQVWGAGPSEVDAWLAAGVTSVAQLRDADWLAKRGVKLSAAIAAGVRYFKQLKQKLPRAVVERVSRVIEKAALSAHSTAKVVLCGSYRRQARECGDIDVLVTRRDGASTLGMLEQIVELLTVCENSIVVAQLTKSGKESAKWMALCQMDAYVAHVDIVCVDLQSLAPTLISMTGSAEFNRAMCQRARKKGFSLGLNALRPVLPGNQFGAPVPVQTEADIFRCLGVDFYEPSQRCWQSVRPLRLFQAPKAELPPHITHVGDDDDDDERHNDEHSDDLEIAPNLSSDDEQAN